MRRSDALMWRWRGWSRRRKKGAAAPAPATLAEPTKVVEGALGAVGKKKKSYRLAGLKCLQGVLTGLEAHDLFSQVRACSCPRQT